MGGTANKLSQHLAPPQPNNRSFWTQLKPTIPPLLLVILGAIFRFAHLGTTRHNYDNGYSAWQALRLIELGEWPIIGQPSSVFLDNPPLMAYLQAAVLLISRSPWTFYVLIVLGNTLAIWFVYDLSKQLLGEKAAVIATLIFAINPWIVHFSRQPWTQGLLPLFLPLLAWCIWPTLAGHIQPKRFLLGFVVLTALTQTYILAFAIVGPLGLLCLIFYRHWPRPQIWQGTVLFVCSLILFAIGLQSQADRNSSKFDSFIDENFLQLRPDALQHALRYVTGKNYTGQDLLHLVPQEPQPILQLAAVALSGLVLIGLIAAIHALISGSSKRPLATILLVWGALPILGLTLFPFIIHPHYLQLTFPALHLLAAWGAVSIISYQRTLYPLTLGLITLFGAQFWLNLAATDQAVAQQPVGWGLDMWALADISEVGQTVYEITADQPAPVRLVGANHVHQISSVSGRVIDLLPDVIYPDFVVIPGERPLYYILRDQQATADLLGPTATHLQQHDLDFLPQTTIRFMQVDPISRDQSGALPQMLVNWPTSSGLTLIGYDLAAASYQAGNMLHVTTYWRVDQLHEARGLWYSSPTYQIVTDQFQLIANISPHGQWGHHWQMGDVYIDRTPIPIPTDTPTGQYHLLLKQFDPVHSQGFPFILNDGTADFVQVPIEITTD